MRAGVFTISLDFELYWGVRDKRALDGYRANLEGVQQAIPLMLDAFARHGVHATWATVGLLFCRDRADALASAPAQWPGYSIQRLCPYRYLESSPDVEPKCHFAPALLDRISTTPGQEIGSHTFSHFYCLEPGQTPESFRADLVAACRIAQRCGVVLRSLVFPRNQWNPDYLPILAEQGITAYRGNEPGWMYAATDGRGQSRLRRLGRLLDSYVNLGGHYTFALDGGGGRPLDIPASRFLRPFDPRLSFLDGLKSRRIFRAMRHAAKRREVFHLWWHPHNFGIHAEENLRMLEAILAEFGRLRSRYGMQSLNLGELADEAGK